MLAVMVNLYLYNEYLRVSQAVYDAHGDAAFEDNFKKYDQEFLYNPKIVAQVEHKKVTDRYAPYNEEHKRVLRHTPDAKAREICIQNALILAMDLYLAMDGKWTQRNWNIMTFGASGSGKTRFFIIPNVLRMMRCRYWIPIRRCMSLRINFLRIIYLKRFSLHSRFKIIKFKREYKEGVLYEQKNGFRTVN